jgi:uncharacterized protein YggE
MKTNILPKDRVALLALFTSFLCASPSLASGENPQQRTMTVSGQGEVKSVPDEAQLSAGVVTQGSTAADALASNSRAMNRVFATLKQLGIPDKAVQTSEFSVSPQYQNDRNGNTTQRIVGYQVSNTVSVTVDDLAKLGATIDVLVGSGANSLGGVSFTIRDPKPLETAAREAAMHDAIEKATTYARAGGVRLGPIEQVTEGNEQPQPIFRAMTIMGHAAAPTPIAAGEQSVSETVTVTFEIS